MEDPLKTEEQTNVDLEWNRDSAELAYSVIARYVEHTQVSGIIIALMASAVGEEKIKPIADSQYWQSYMASKRSITEAKLDVDRLTEMIERLRLQSE
ncbi:MAG: hypothetical protein IPG76_22980 [Acidobacteria bacterium]|nr:hypothetical protein [Acidobacteriota bacterium]